VNRVKSEYFNIDRIVEIPITDFLEFDRSGKALCIWHSDRNPSLYYYKKQNKVHCFSCAKGGNVIDVMAVVWGIEKKDTMRKLNKLLR